jgi:phosphoribosylformimino-5-aminoimidazole carboxamide ribotide isomerase
MPIRVIPVLDVQSGTAVHAVGGNRAHYGPLVSRLHAGTNPISLASALQTTFGFRELYLADLDAIAGRAPDVALYGQLHVLGLALWVDAGVRDASMLPALRDPTVHTIIVGLESVRGATALAEVISAVGPERVLFSVDLRDGRPIVAQGADWGTADARTIAEKGVALGVRRLLLLDLARVGRGRGVGTLPLLRRLHAAHLEVELAVGGGIARASDLPALADAGASAALIGSALHDGRIQRDDLDASPDEPSIGPGRPDHDDLEARVSRPLPAPGHA